MSNYYHRKELQRDPKKQNQLKFQVLVWNRKINCKISGFVWRERLLEVRTPCSVRWNKNRLCHFIFYHQNFKLPTKTLAVEQIIVKEKIVYFNKMLKTNSTFFLTFVLFFVSSGATVEASSFLTLPQTQMKRVDRFNCHALQIAH
jgi:hypothetical protein